MHVAKITIKTSRSTLPGRYSYALYMICNVGCSILRRSLDHVNIRNASRIDIGARGLSHESGVNESDGRRRWKRKVGNVQDVCSESNLIVKERILKHLTIETTEMSQLNTRSRRWVCTFRIFSIFPNSIAVCFNAFEVKSIFGNWDSKMKFVVDILD